MPLLLSKGADPNKAAKDQNGNVFTPLYEATWEGDTEIVRNLLESKADPNMGNRRTDKDGNVTVETPLFMAASRGYTEIVRSLLASEARLDLDTGEDEEDLADHTSLSLLPITAMSSSSPTGMSKDRH